MAAEQNQEWVYVKRPTKEVTAEHYQLRSGPIPTPGPGQVTIKSLYISVDPYLRIQQAATNNWEEPHPLNTVQGAGVVGEVINVDNAPDSGLAVGDLVSWYGGWRKYGVADVGRVHKLDKRIQPPSLALGALGMPGRTAYFSFIESGKPKKGETVVVSGAAGAVGSLVCQIAKIYGCNVIGIAGSEEKQKYLVEEIGCSKALNYHEFNTQEKMQAALASACPNGIDIYYDNTGGFITDAVFPLINLRARIIICGQISQYNGQLDAPELGPRFLHHVLYQRATIQGILSRDYEARNSEMVDVMAGWIKEGKLKPKETVVEGFENLPAALNSLFHGKNTGKLVVKVA